MTVKKTEWSTAMTEYVNLVTEAIDIIVDEWIEPLGDIGSPEKLIGKPYEEWTPQDLQMLGQVYGAEPNALSDLIFTKKYAEVKRLEQEVS